MNRWVASTSLRTIMTSRRLSLALPARNLCTSMARSCRLVSSSPPAALPLPSPPPPPPSWASLGQQALDLIKTWLRRRAYFVAFGATVVTAGLYYIWSTESDAGVVSEMCGVFEKGGVAGWDAGFKNDARASVSRPAVEADLKAILRPSVVNKYAVIVGQSGTGKSTSVRKVVRALIEEGKGNPAGAGIIYYSAGVRLPTFSKKLAHAVGYHVPVDFFDRIRRMITDESKPQKVAPPPHEEPGATWDSMCDLLTKAAIKYEEEHHKAPTLVLDAMDLVAKSDPQFFRVVQDFAKLCADGGIMRVVLVFSDGEALPLLFSSSAESRLKKNQVYEVGDISDTDAINFVSSTYDMDEIRAKELVETITGGRFPLLQDFGDSKLALDAIRERLNIDTNRKFRSAGLKLTHPLFKKLVQSSSIATDEADEMLESGQIGQLLRSNILAVHPNGTYTFNTNHVKERVKKALAVEAASNVLAAEAATKLLAAEAAAKLLAEEAAANARRWW